MDNPNYKYVDGWFVSSQQHEIDYFVDQLVKAHPTKKRSDVVQAFERARKAIQPSEGREKLKAAVARLLA
jgi:F0F1-type ATP synthase epsilon subunit